MKYLVLILFSMNAFAQELPEYLKDGVITVTLKNGKTYTFSSNDYMVARRDQADANVGQALAAGESEGEYNAMKRAEQVVEAAYRPWRGTLLGGVGSDGNSVQYMGNEVHVDEKRTFVYGAELSYEFRNHYSLGATALSNQTYLLGAGYNFK